MAQLSIEQVGVFHNNHGSNIVLLGEGTVAYRKNFWKTYGDGVVFAKYPITIGELFEVKIEDMDVDGWYGPRYGSFEGSLVSKNLVYRYMNFNA